MMLRRRFALLAALALALGLATGCDDGDASTETDTAMTADTAETTGDATTDPGETTDPGDVTEPGDTTATTDTAMDTVEPDATVMCDPPNGVRPPRLSEHVGAYAHRSDRFIVFGGSLGIPENCGFPTRTYESTTWIYDTNCDQWTEHTGAAPGGRARSAATYDSLADRMLVFGGLTSFGNLNDTWAFDVATETWTQLETTGTAPAPRFNHTIAFDPVDNRLLVFGGNRGTVLGALISNDVWALDLATNAWSNVTPADGGPAPRTWVAGAWDGKSNRFVVYGGGSDTALTSPDPNYFDDIWGWSDAGGTPTWINLAVGGGDKPVGRFWPALAYDPVSESMLLFGGHDDANDTSQNLLGNRNDTWFFDGFAGTWSEHLVGDQFNSPATGFCEFPPDYTIIEEASPERRNAAAVGAGPDGVYIMGGKTDCGVIDDLIFFDWTTRAWSKPTRATQGEVCLRRGGGASCTDMCL